MWVIGNRNCCTKITERTSSIAADDRPFHRLVPEHRHIKREYI